MVLTQKASRSLVLACAAFYLIVVAVLFFQIRIETGGHFIYPLDDPYIHLALAAQIAHGHYGINAAEFSSPSSSALWPLLLVPFASRSWHHYLPLIWNILFGLTASCLIAKLVDRWPPCEKSTITWSKKFITAILLMAVANLFSLTLLGMEHVLQVLLSIACAFGVMEALDGNEIPTWCLIAAVAGPLVRYENLSLTLAVSIALAARHKPRKAISVFLLSLIPPALFGLFLKSLNLPFLPDSVLVKARLFTGHTGVVAHALWTLVIDFYLFIHESLRWPMAILALLLVYGACVERDRIRRKIYAGAALVPILQLLVGRFGWFHRYEVFAAIFSTLIAMRLYSAKPRIHFACITAALLFFSLPYLAAVARTAEGSTEVYRQQYQMARFAHNFYKGNIAVNDLGLVSYKKPPSAYVLDLYGLASQEAAEQIDKTPKWLNSIVHRYGANLAIVYPAIFHIPPDWLPMAQMCLPSEPKDISGRCVVFYSTSLQQRESIRTELQQFATTLPPGIVFTLNPTK